MAKEHPRTGVPHDIPDALPVSIIVAVDRAFQAGGLVFYLGAGVELLFGVCHEFPAVRAQLMKMGPIRGLRFSMIPSAVQPDHERHGLEFPHVPR